jgi:hypothetical protein
LTAGFGTLYELLAHFLILSQVLAHFLILSPTFSSFGTLSHTFSTSNTLFIFIFTVEDLSQPIKLANKMLRVGINIFVYEGHNS